MFFSLAVVLFLIMIIHKHCSDLKLVMIELVCLKQKCHPKSSSIKPHVVLTLDALNDHQTNEKQINLTDLFFFFTFLSEVEEFDHVLRDRSHIDETLRLAAEEKATDYAGEEHKGIRLLLFTL